MITSAVALVAAACGDDGGDDGDGAVAPVTTGAPTTTVDTGITAVDPNAAPGGVLTAGMILQPTSLDPIVTPGSGSGGGTEMSAVYDTLMIYDSRTDKYLPGTAESAEPNADFTLWTVKLKPNIKFSDGTAYDAEAVKFGLDRHRVGTPGGPACEALFACPRNATSSTGSMSLVSDIKVVDPLTLEIRLTTPWTGFRYVLADDVGMIPSPTALRSQCKPGELIRNCTFNLKPVGAGPFVVSKFSAGEAIEMTRNPNYWRGPVKLEKLVFVTLGDSGSNRTLDALTTKTLDLAFLTDPVAVAEADKEKLPGYSNVPSAVPVLQMNMGVRVQCAGGKPEQHCAGKPDGPTTTETVTKSLKVRQAITAAIDVGVINQRAYSGVANATSSLFTTNFKWDPGVKGPSYDPSRAQSLVKEAKAEGWSGNLRFKVTNSPTNLAVGQAAKTMLEAAGIAVDMEALQVNELITRLFSGDFDLITSSFALTNDDFAAVSLLGAIGSKSASNRSGWISATVDEGLTKVLAARDDSQKKEGFKMIQEALNTDLPVLPYIEQSSRIVGSTAVRGLRPNHSGTVQFWNASITR
jgi:peptide/nickel transport system substrate-binding protein